MGIRGREMVWHIFIMPVYGGIEKFYPLALRGYEIFLLSWHTGAFGYFEYFVKMHIRANRYFLKILIRGHDNIFTFWFCWHFPGSWSILGCMTWSWNFLEYFWSLSGSQKFLSITMPGHETHQLSTIYTQSCFAVSLLHSSFDNLYTILFCSLSSPFIFR